MTLAELMRAADAAGAPLMLESLYLESDEELATVNPARPFIAALVHAGLTESIATGTGADPISAIEDLDLEEAERALRDSGVIP